MEHQEVLVSRDDEIAAGHDGGRQDVSIRRVPKPREPMEKSFVRLPWQDLRSKQRHDFLCLLSEPRELLDHDRTDFSLNILRNDESVFLPERRQEDSTLCSGKGDSRDNDVRIEEESHRGVPRRAPLRARRRASLVIPLRLASRWNRSDNSRNRVSARRSTTKSPTSSASRYVSSEILRSFRIRAGSVSCPFVVTFTTSAIRASKESLLFEPGSVVWY